MKKIVFILAILALDTFAINCRDYMRLSVSFWNFDEYHLDSVYAANYFGSTVYYTESKLLYKNDNLISTGRCYGDDCEYWPIEVVTVKTDTTKNKTIYMEGTLLEEELTSIDGDSSTLISYHKMKDTLTDEEVTSLEGDTSTLYRIIKNRIFMVDDMTISFLKNDTLNKLEMKLDMLKAEFEDKKVIIIAPDASNENICNVTVYEYPENDTTLQNLQNIIDEYQDTITNTDNGFIVSFSNSDEKWFYVLANASTTSIRRKVRPAVIPEKSRKFDLLGRPAKGRYTINFMK